MSNRMVLHGAIALLLSVAAVGIAGKGMSRAGIGNDDAKTALEAEALWQQFPPAGFDVSFALKPSYLINMGLPITMFAIPIFGRFVPLAYCDYMGPWTIYSFLPYLAISDRGLAIRAYILTWVAAAVLSVYVAAFTICGSVLIASLAGLATATWPFMAELIKSGYSASGIIAVPLGLIGMTLLIWAARRRSTAAWYLSCFVVGLSVGSFAQCLAFLVAWVLAVFWLRDRVKGLLIGRRGAIGWSGVCLLLGNIPLLLANVLYPSPRWFTFRYIARHFVVSSGHTSNGRYLLNLGNRLGQACQIFGGYWLLIGVATIVMIHVALLIHHGSRSSQRIRLVPAIYLCSLLLLSPFTWASLSAYHIVALFPLGMLYLSGFSRIRWRRFGTVLACMALATVLAANASGLRAYRESIRNGDPVSPGVPPLEELSLWLTEQGRATTVLIGSNLAINYVVAWLTDDRVRAFEWGPNAEGDWSNVEPRLEEEIKLGNKILFVVQPEDFSHLSALCARHRQTLRPLKQFLPYRQFVVRVYEMMPATGSSKRGSSMVRR